MCVALGVMAQSFSYPTDTVNGKVYYLYPVQKGEGLYRISKTFEVSQEDLVAVNPELAHSGLKLGQIIRIPYVSKIDSSQYIVHEVQPKETLYGLSKRYQVKQEDILRLNPVVAKKMNIGARLLIPKMVQQPVAEKVVSGNNRKDTVKVESLKQPVVVADTLSSSVMPVAVLVDTLTFSSEGTDLLVPDSLSAVFEPVQVPLRIAFLLPLMAEVAKREPAIDRFVEFYEGALLAIRDAQKEGRKFEIYVYDTEKSVAKIQRILRQPEMLNMDAVVGPAYPSQVSAVSQFAYENHVPVLVPFTSKVSDIDRNPYLLQFNPSEEAETGLLYDWLVRKGDSVHCVCIGMDEETVSSEVRSLYQKIGKSDLSVAEVSLSAVLNDSLAEVLVPDRENILILYSEKYRDVEPLIPYLKTCGKNYTLQMLSYYAWQKEERLPVPVFYTSVFSSLSLIPLMTYAFRYNYWFRHEVGNDTPRYDVLGYDLTSWLICMLQQDAQLSLQQRIEQTDYKGLQSSIRFLRKTDIGGYENQGLRILTR